MRESVWLAREFQQHRVGSHKDKRAGKGTGCVYPIPLCVEDPLSCLVFLMCGFHRAVWRSANPYLLLLFLFVVAELQRILYKIGLDNKGAYVRRNLNRSIYLHFRVSFDGRARGVDGPSFFITHCLVVADSKTISLSSLNLSHKINHQENEKHKK